jgi:hypothetical protein
MSQRPLMLQHLAQVAAVNPTAAPRAPDEMLDLETGRSELARERFLV